MSVAALARRLTREESGFALIAAVILLGVMSTLITLVMSLGTHANTSSARNRSHVQALHVAEAGVQDAIAEIQSLNGVFTSPMTLNGSTDEGTFTTTVTSLARNRILVESDGVVPGAAGLGAARSLQVTMAPPVSFEYALFSSTSLETKNNDDITGDIWANQNVRVYQNDIVRGSVVAATGWIKLDNGSVVEGDAWSGGWDPGGGDIAIHVDLNARIGGTAKASVTAPTCAGEEPTRYKIRIEGGGVIAGDATTWGPVTGSGTVLGTITPDICTAAPPTQQMPTFTYSSSNYDPAGLHEFGTPDTPSAIAVVDFQNYLSTAKTALSGTYYINQTEPVSQSLRVDLTGVTIVGDLTIITNVPVFANGVTDNTGDAIFTLVSTYRPPTGTTCDVNNDSSECSIHLKNNFEPSGKTAVLVYAPYGPVAIKNNQVQYGAIYADNIQIKNNQTLVYDDRIERVAGFGDVTYEVLRWLELAP